MPGTRKRTWGKLAFVILSMVAGCWVYSVIDKVLTPQPSVSRFPDINLDLWGANAREYHFDRTARWLAVLISKQEELLRRYRVFDLQSEEKQVGEFDWYLGRRIAITPINQGARTVSNTLDNRLEIVDKDFVTGQERKLDFDLPCPDNYLRMQFTNAGRRLVILHRWPLWPWQALAGMGKPPWDALAQCASSEQTYTTTDGLMVSVYDVAASKLLRTAFLAPPNNSAPILTEDGHWLIMPEAYVSNQSLFWMPWRGGKLPNDSIKPAQPRGIRVLDLHTGETKVLQHEVSAQLKQMSVGAYSVNWDNDFLRACYVQAVRVAPDFIGFIIPSQELNDDGYPQFDMRTGKKSTHLFPANTELGQSGWQFNCSTPQRTWFPFLQKGGEAIGVDLNKSYPLPANLNVNFERHGDVHEFFQQTMRTVGAERVHYVASADGNAAIVLRGLADGTEILRWQLPFTVYPAWWSIAAGVVASCVLLMGLKLTRRLYRQRAAVLNST